MIKIIKLLYGTSRSGIKHLIYKDTLPQNPMHDDIYIVEFPKSGITWLSFVLGSVELKICNISELLTYYNHHRYIIDIHQVRNSSIHRFLNRTFIKSHSVFNPYYYFVIYLIRNPFDVMVSYYNFMLSFGYQDTFDKFVRDKKYGICKWKAHVNSWIHKKTDVQRIHLIKYEELITDAESAITKLYNNLGVEIDRQLINESLKEHSVEKMASSENFYRQHNPNYNMTCVGKKNKIKKEDLLTEDITQYIYSKAKNELNTFYPDIVANMK